jgi:large subunit ribosomal protein L19
MSQAIIEQVEAAHLNNSLPEVQVGDTVDVHLRIIEGDKERTQVFTGVVISLHGRGINRMMTVRRIVANEGVERVLPLHSPRIAKIEVKRSGHTRRARLFYLRDRVGKSRRLRDRRRGLNRARVQVPGEKAPAAAAEAPADTEASEKE